MRTHGVNQAYSFVEGIWLHRKSRQIRFFFGKIFGWIFGIWISINLWSDIRHFLIYRIRPDTKFSVRLAWYLDPAAVLKRVNSGFVKTKYPGHYYAIKDLFAFFLGLQFLSTTRKFFGRIFGYFKDTGRIPVPSLLDTKIYVRVEGGSCMVHHIRWWLRTRCAHLKWMS